MPIIKREQDKKKSPFEATKPIDTADIKMVEARYNNNPFFIGIGVAKQREVKGVGQVGMEGVKGEYQSQKDLDWQFLYNLDALPHGFMPRERLEVFMAGTASIVTGSAAAYSKGTKFIETDSVTIEEAKQEDPIEFLSKHSNLPSSVTVKKKRKKV